MSTVTVSVLYFSCHYFVEKDTKEVGGITGQQTQNSV